MIYISLINWKEDKGQALSKRRKFLGIMEIVDM